MARIKSLADKIRGELTVDAQWIAVDAMIDEGASQEEIDVATARANLFALLMHGKNMPDRSQAVMVGDVRFCVTRRRSVKLWIYDHGAKKIDKFTKYYYRDGRTWLVQTIAVTPDVKTPYEKLAVANIASFLTYKRWREDRRFDPADPNAVQARASDLKVWQALSSGRIEIK